MDNQKKLFRKVAMDRLSSPEQLDTLMRITTPKGWIALAAIVGFLVLTVIWGMFGSIPTIVLGQGLFVRSGGVMQIESNINGQLTNLTVDVGDDIYEGQVFARIAQKEFLEQLSLAQWLFDRVTEEKKQQIELLGQKASLSNLAIEQERIAVKAMINSLHQEVIRLKEKVRDHQYLVKDGLITKNTLAQTQLTLAKTRNDIISAQAKLKQLTARKAQTKHQSLVEEVSLNQRLSESERQVALLRERLFNTSRVIAPYNGKVVEIMATEGDFLQIGSSILSMERTGRDIADLEIVAYLSPIDGKKVLPGMLMQIEPSIIKKEEFGTLLATVISVAEYPSSSKGMLKVLGNPELVRMMSSLGPPIEIRGSLIPDSNTFSKYRWTSKGGPPLKLGTGIIATVSITTREQPPITLVIPLLKSFFGV